MNPRWAAIAMTVSVGFGGTTFADSFDLVAGAGRFDRIDAKVEVFAKSGPAGEDPRGRLSLRQGENIDITGKVLCLAVLGNEAVAGGVITDSGDPSLIGTAFLQYIRDNPDRGQDDEDESRTILDSFRDSFACPPLPIPIELVMTDRGTYLVKDGQP